MKSFKEQADELIEIYSRTKRQYPETKKDCYEKHGIQILIRAGEYFLDKFEKVNEASNYIGLLEDEYIEINTSIIKLKEVIK